jgi:shikimate dehydrogenase
MLNGDTKIIAHVGYPTSTFKSPMIYNPWFDKKGVNACVVFYGALVTMPHKVSVIDLLDQQSTAVRIAGSCNAVRRDADGRLIGDMFDGEGFVRGVGHNGVSLKGARALIVGSGGVGSAIAASTAAAGAAEIALYDVNAASMEDLADRLRQNYPRMKVCVGSNDPAGFDVVVNATPLGMKPGDPMPVDVSRLSPSTFVGEVVLKAQTTAFLAAAKARGCPTQVGVDMLFEQIPVYLQFFGFPQTTAAELREGAHIQY